MARWCISCLTKSAKQLKFYQELHLQLFLNYATQMIKTLLYHEVPQCQMYTNNKFTRRKRGQDVDRYPGIKKNSAMGWVYNVYPYQSGCFYLLMLGLLHHIRGSTSFESLRTVNGEVKETYQAVCRDGVLLESVEYQENTRNLRDVAVFQSAIKLRESFGILLFCQPSKPLKLWEIYKQDLCEDTLNRIH